MNYKRIKELSTVGEKLQLEIGSLYAFLEKGEMKSEEAKQELIKIIDKKNAQLENIETDLRYWIEPLSKKHFIK